ncbi:hypothetical protein THRCLA_00894 [Thraustotheca clavata]|uniref:Uncharacterized protein n=1 Tax=Thraustotheca clavata TaxID=74557 RepID=A0A1W0A9Y4_9STRA|nr:hypothetical protein THRCLA_00894 [Thraustotheca clavata]
MVISNDEENIEMISKSFTVVDLSALIVVNSNDEIDQLVVAAFEGEITKIIASYDSFVGFLIKNDSLINSTNKYGESPLHTAASKGHKNIVELLVQGGANIESTVNNFVQPALTYSLSTVGHHFILPRLEALHKQFSFSSGQSGETPLHLAASKGHERVVSLLVNAGAFVDAPDKVPEYRFVDRLLLSAIANKHERVAENWCFNKVDSETSLYD